jgi:hypothetical protein
MHAMKGKSLCASEEGGTAGIAIASNLIKGTVKKYRWTTNRGAVEIKINIHHATQATLAVASGLV